MHDPEQQEAERPDSQNRHAASDQDWGPGADVDVRQDRIVEHIADAMQQEDPLQASLGGANGDLLLLQYSMGKKLNEALAQDPESLPDLLPTMQTYIKLNQQVDRFTQLGLKLQAAQERRANVTPNAAPATSVGRPDA